MGLPVEPVAYCDYCVRRNHTLGFDYIPLFGFLGVAPEEFQPERWEHLVGDMPGFIPFNKGPRICHGSRCSLLVAVCILSNNFVEHYSMIVLIYIIARMFQAFSMVRLQCQAMDRKNRHDENENGVLIGLTLAPEI